MEEQKPFWKKPIFIIGLGGAFFIILIIIVVIAATTADPLREYEKRFSKYAQDCSITAEERMALDTYAQNKKLLAVKTKEIEARILAERCAGKIVGVLQEKPEPIPKGRFEEEQGKPPIVHETIPVEAKLNLQQGMNYAKAKDYDNAIKEFTLAIQKYPQYDVAYSNRAVVYMQQKKFNKAMDDLQKAFEINPNNPMVHYNFTCFYSLRNQLDRSLDSLDKALELGFNDYDALRTDTDLNTVRKHPEFKKILEKHKVFIMG
jgi:tetratricopeptide (TPR) repeat protein